MKGWAIQLFTVTSVLVTQTHTSVQQIQTLPPVPDQSVVRCHDAAWEQTNLSSVSGMPMHKKLSPLVQKLLIDAQTQFVPMTINVAYRTCDYQLQLRGANCGLGDYNLYQKPSEQCNPPTEPAGRSLHNEGLAIDFACSGYAFFESSPCLTWLKQNAASYNLYNHELEAWHWSTTGK